MILSPKTDESVARDDTSVERGSVLLYLIAMFVVFGLIGAGMVSIYNTAVSGQSVMNQSYRSNLSAASGVRWAMAQGYAGGENALVSINQVTQTLDGNNKFTLAINPYYFKNATVSSGTSFTASAGMAGLAATFPTTKPVNATLLLKTASDQPIVSVTSYTYSAGAKTLAFVVNSSLNISDSPVFLAFQTSGNQTSFAANGTLTIANTSVDFFPDSGSFCLGDSAGIDSNLFYYKSRVQNGTSVTLSGLAAVSNSTAFSAWTTVPDQTYVILGQNYGLVSQGQYLAGNSSIPVNSTGSVWYVANATIPSGVTVSSDDIIESAGPPGTAGNTASDFVSGVGMSGGATITINNNYIQFGNNLYQGLGCIWYQGNNQGCVNGNCTLNYGLRGYYEFYFTNTSNADGFTFALMSAYANSNASCGGDTAMGELLSYGGKGSSGRGINPPKMAIEFDTYHNDGNSNLCSPGSRNDYTNDYDHLSTAFWGALTTSNTCSGDNQTYDDNRHGAGTAGSSTQPQNSNNPDGSGNGMDGYYYGSTQTWLKDGKSNSLPTAFTNPWVCRVEILRRKTPNSLGKYCYQIKGWLDRKTNLSTTALATFSDVTQKYYVTPLISDTVCLDKSYHDLLDKVYWGWTQATGASTQLAYLYNYIFKFVRDDPQTISVPDGAVAAWNFDDMSSTSAYSSVISTYDNTATLRGDAAWRAGQTFGGISFSGSSGTSRVAVTDNNSLHLTTAGSLGAWIYVRSFSDSTPTEGVIHKGQRTNRNDESYSLQFNGDQRISFGMETSGGNWVMPIVRSTTYLQTGRWYHVLATWDSSGAKMYVNGVLENSNSNAYTAATTTGRLVIGARFDQSAYDSLDGVLDNVIIYNRALTAAEVLQLYNAQIE